MGFFTEFLMNGFSRGGEQLYGPGTLFEMKARLSDNFPATVKMDKVRAVIGSWYTSREMLAELGREPSVYALEVHAVNDPSEGTRHGYGTYVFIPDEVRDASITPLTTTFSEPVEIQDDEDPLKILAETYADESGYSKSPSLAVYELGLRREFFYPLRVWDKGDGDPMEGMFSIFETMPPGAFAGMSLVMVQPQDNWQQPAYNRIRAIEDPTYVENMSRARQLFHLMKTGERAATGDTTLAGYEKKPLSPQERDEIAEINKKAKTGTVAFRCTMRIYASNSDLAMHLADVISQRTSTPTQGQALVVEDQGANLRAMAMREEGNHSFILSADEIATLWHVPDEALYGEKGHGGRLCHRPSSAATRPPDNLVTIRTGGPADLQAIMAKLISGGM